MMPKHSSSLLLKLLALLIVEKTCAFFTPHPINTPFHNSQVVRATTNIISTQTEETGERKLQQTIYLRGPVDTGYGRGGKKLGIPTANLPSSLFSNALQNVPTGVYFGWAVIESSNSIRTNDEEDDDKSINVIQAKGGRNEIHKAVVNVGYSPTFDGEENKEKIVEAHLIVDDGVIDGDFYGETMRLSLYGFLRPGKFCIVSPLL